MSILCVSTELLVVGLVLALVLIESERKRAFNNSEHLVNLLTDLHAATFCN